MKGLNPNAFTGETFQKYNTYKKNYGLLKEADSIYQTLVKDAQKSRASTYLKALITSQDGQQIREEYRAYGRKLHQEKQERDHAIQQKVDLWKRYFEKNPQFLDDCIKDRFKIDPKFFHKNEENMYVFCKEMRDIPKKYNYTDIQNMMSSMLEYTQSTHMSLYITVAQLNQDKDMAVVRFWTKQPCQREGHYDHNYSCIMDVGYPVDTIPKAISWIFGHQNQNLDCLEETKKGGFHVKKSVLFKI